MTKRAGILVAAGATVAGLLAAAPAPAAASGASAPPAPKLAWTDCPTENHPTLQCAKVDAPLDHADPSGRRVTLALSRIPHTAKTFQGPPGLTSSGPWKVF
ncbi:alpha/beta hydrolase, partial [Streptomyces sp. MBT57]|nr:alpha/beta hydrolase [Streptomyces sp. MBT57]